MRAVAALARRSVRAGSGRFLVEGPQGVRELVRYAAPSVVDLYVTAAAAQRYAALVESASAAGVFVHSVSDEVLAAMADAETPQGMLAVAQQPEPTLADVLAASPRLLVLLQEVRDPGNLGTVIRAADASGADAVLVTDSSVDVFSPKVVRSTAGSLFHLPVVTGLDAEATLAEVASHGIRTLATEGEAALTLPHVDLAGRHCWVLGTEAQGLPDHLAAACAERVSIPIYGKAESLNLAMAATICLYASAAAQHGTQ
ncbi:TrmH family RNA methyltransferase [Nostocoides australiense]|nr:RNA methyltransferase [Tetrasphaera australiensis]HRW00844.1 RNA methyltransferase [Tetrasphaera sp.]